MGRSRTLPAPARAALPLVALLLVAVAISGVVLDVTSDRAVRVSRNVLVDQPGPIDAVNSPTVAQNPRRPDNVVVSYRVDRPQYSALLQASFDNGATWRPTPLPLPAGNDRAFAPDLAFTPAGLLHVIYTNLTGNGNTPDNLWLATSTDGGRTLGQPVRIAGALAFQPRLVVASNGTIFVTWLQADSVGFLSFTGKPPVLLAVRSTDGGHTFSAPVQVNEPARLRVGAASPVVDSAGHLQILYEDFKDDRRDFENLDGPPYDGTFALVLATSVDGGQTFGAGSEIDSGLVPIRRFLAFLPDFPSLAAGPDESLYVSWADGRAGDDDVYFKRSTNAGESWTKAAPVDTGPATKHTSQYLPRVAVSPGGRVDVAYLDRRRDPADVMTDVSLATSANDGSSFDTVRLSDKAFDSGVGPITKSELGADSGTRVGLASAGSTAIAVWADTRFGTQTTGRQDIVGAGIRFPGAVPRVAQTATILVLLVLALGALVAWRVTGASVRPSNSAA